MDPSFVEFQPVERKRRNLEDFSDEQKYYLDILSKFSQRQQYSKSIRAEDKPTHKEIMVKEYFNYLNVNEQVQWNDLQQQYKKHTNASLYLTGGAFSAGCVYYLMVTPNTKSLGFQAVKSGVASLLIGFSYFKYQQALYFRDLHKFYILTLDRVKNRRRVILDQ
ncbi:hypothetical protein ABPG72_016775 [Tetrahymena utriculariae]